MRRAAPPWRAVLRGRGGRRLLRGERRPGPPERPGQGRPPRGCRWWRASAGGAASTRRRSTTASAPGVVTILSIFDGNGASIGEEGAGGQGSGFVLDGDGYIATNAHVVTEEGSAKRAEQVYVEFSDGNRVEAKIVGVDPNADVALLHVDPAGLSLTPLQLGHSRGDRGRRAGRGDRQPLRGAAVARVGVVSAVDRNISSLTRFGIGDAIQTDAAINPGNSGGPLLDAKGVVLGINAQIKTDSGGGEGVGFAVPVDAVRRSLTDLRAHGRVDYAYLGVTTLTLWPQLAERLGLPNANGALIQKIEDGSPAEKADMKAGDDEITFQGQSGIRTGGDVIVALNGRPLTRSQDLTDGISALGSGDTARLTLLRDGKRRTVDVKLGTRHRDPAGRVHGRGGGGAQQGRRTGCVADDPGPARLPGARPAGPLRGMPPHSALARGGGRPEARDHRGGQRLRGRRPLAGRREPRELQLPPAGRPPARCISTARPARCPRWSASSAGRSSTPPWTSARSARTTRAS